MRIGRGDRPSVEPGSRDEGVDAAIAAWEAKCFEDLGNHDGATEFMRSHALVEVASEVASGIIERKEDFSRRNTCWRW